MVARSALFFILILVSLDAAVVAALGRGLNRVDRDAQTGQSGAAGDDAQPAGAEAIDTGWALCQTRFEGTPVTPSTVAVTYLDAGVDDDLVPGDVRAWFGPVAGVQIDVYKLELRSGRRRIALELSQGKWPTWQQVAAGKSGEAVCGLVRAALLDAGIGRPRLPSHVSPYQAPSFADDDPTLRMDSERKPATERPYDDDDDDGQGAGQAMDPESDQAGMDRSRHDFEFIHARRPRLYRRIEWVGTLDHALELDTFVALRQWLNRSEP